MPYANRSSSSGAVCGSPYHRSYDVGRQPEVGAEVDDVRDAFDELRDQQLRLAVRQREEHEVEAAEVGDVDGAYREVAVGGLERRVQVADRRARVRVGGDVHDLDLGVAGEQPQQLGPCVP